MLHLHDADRLPALAAGLADILADAPADPLEPEWIAVASDGVGRWLSLELARHLGASTPGGGDGVAANITFRYPGSLRAEVLAAGRRQSAPPTRTVDVDPWTRERLTWVILALLEGVPATGALASLADLGPGGSAVGRARSIADGFDRYHLRRPHMVRAWVEGRDLDGTGRALLAHHRWQPELWRQVRAEIGVPSPPEMLPALLSQLRLDSLAVDLPGRVVLFGVSVLPGGAGFVDLAEALAAHRDVHLCLLDPSPTAAHHLRHLAPPDGRGELFPPQRTRAADTTVDEVRNPLLRSWGRLPRETAVLVGDAERQGRLPARQRVDRSEVSSEPTTLLGRIQADLRADRPPDGTFKLAPEDDSVQFHTAHGPVRQIEVLRDALLHRLQEDPTLNEDDIVVICPALDRFAPLIEIGLGPSASTASQPSTARGGRGPAAGPPALRYRLADRSIRPANQMAAALLTLLEAAGGRCDAITVIDVAAQPAIRRRYHVDDDDLGRLTSWVAETNVRWGLDTHQRARLGLPATVTANTWQAGLDRLLLGAAIAADGETFAVGEVVPYGIEGDATQLAGSVADLAARLSALADAAEHPRPVADWVAVVSEVAVAAIASDTDDEWESDRLAGVLADLVDDAATTPRTTSVPVTYADFRRLLDERLASTRGRPDFFRGGVTITSPDSLRAVPHRVLCLLGLDQGALSAGTVDGDDLAALVPMLGDPDDQAGGRQGLLDAVLAAGDHLIVVRNGHDLRTNQAIPAPVAVAELLDLVRATIAPVEPGEPEAIAEVHHPRQAFDERNFVSGALPDRHGPGPWSFDPGAQEGAEARRRRAHVSPPFLAAPLSEPAGEDRPPLVVELADLHAAVTKPIKAFLDRRLELRLPTSEDAPATRLPVEVIGLDEWHIGTRVLDALRRGVGVDHAVALERASGSLPPGALAERKLTDILDRATAIATAAEVLGVISPSGDDLSVDVDVVLDDGTRIVGQVPQQLSDGSRGPARVGYSKFKSEHHLSAWLDLMALVATDPEVDWRSVAVYRKDDYGKTPKADTRDLVALGADPIERRRLARDALTVAVDLFRRSRCDALPLFPKLSEPLYRGTAKPTLWSTTGGYSFADRDDTHVAVAYGDLDYDDVLHLPTCRDDPPGQGAGRAQRYAAYLWAAVERSSIERDDRDQRDADPGGAS